MTYTKSNAVSNHGAAEYQSSHSNDILPHPEESIKHSNSVIHSQKIPEYGGAEHSVSLSGEEITLNNPDGEIFHFPARLLPEYVGTFHDMDKAYGGRGFI